MKPRTQFDAIVIGGGPAGLTAALELAGHRRRAVVLEATDQLGGISKTVQRDGWRFDLGGHRFFTKVPRVSEFWRSVLTDEDFLLRPRLSRIFYGGRFYDYPLKAGNAIRNLGPWESARCVASYLRARVFPPRDQSTFEGWVAARFGWRLYRTFFKTYTEKVWGVPAHTLQADWASQRIRNLSLGRAIWEALRPLGRESADQITSLVERFHYPRLGPGMMWEACAERARLSGQEIHLGAEAVRIRRIAEARVAVETRAGHAFEAPHVITSMPLGHLAAVLDPRPPAAILDAASSLRHRDFLTVALVIPKERGFPDNWIYIHAPDVRVGRIQNFGSWSPDMVRNDGTCLGLEYFVTRGDDIWNQDDSDLIALATRELEYLGLAPADSVRQGFVVRVDQAYPVYHPGYQEAVDVIRSFLERDWPELHPVGRNGMHRYNNQDHSMLTAMLTVDNIVLGTDEDVWTVNVDPDYHESTGRHEPRTGRNAPIVRPS